MMEAGTLLIEKNTPRPECFELTPYSGPNSWVPFAHNLSTRDLATTLAANGWTFSYLAGAIRATGFGFSAEKRMDSVLKQLSALATKQACNCLQIDEVADHSFLGARYVSVSAHSRNVQKERAFTSHQVRPV